MNSSSSETGSLVKHAEFTPTFRLVGSSIYFCLLLFALWLNLFQMAVYIRGYNNFKNMAFFIIAWQLVFNDILICTVYIIFNMMIMFHAHEKTFHPVLYKALAYFESFSYNGLLCFAFLLCLNRLAVFALPKVAKVFFERPRIFVLIGIVWTFVTVLITGIMSSPCPIVVNIEDMFISPSCIIGGNVFNQIGLFIATYIPVLMIIIYFLIFLELKVGIFNNIRCCRVLKMPMKHSKQEVMLLVQSFLICGTFFIQNFMWSYLPFMTKNLAIGNELVYFVIMLTSVLLFTVDAIVVLTINSTFKEVAASFFRRSTPNIMSLYTIPPRRMPVAHINSISPWNSYD